MPNFNWIGLGISEFQVAENRYLPLTGGIALTTVYTLTCYTLIIGWWFICRHNRETDPRAPYAKH